MTATIMPQAVPDGRPQLFTTDLLCAIGGAVAGTAGIVLMYREPVAIFVSMLLLLAVLLLRWHTPQDLVGLAVGMTFGNVTELLCDARDVWIHATRDVVGVAPAYILVCYPILMLTVPRLINGLVRRARPLSDGEGSALPHALVLWALHLGLSLVDGANNALELGVSAVLLAVSLARFHGAHDVACALFGAALGMVWEIPATVSGAWHFPAPQLFGLIPAYLPLAYAVFFVNLGRVTVGLAARARVSVGPIYDR